VYREGALRKSVVFEEKKALRESVVVAWKEDVEKREKRVKKQGVSRKKWVSRRAFLKAKIEENAEKERFARIVLQESGKRVFFESGFTAAGCAQSNKRLPLAKWLVRACGCSRVASRTVA
jgi:hypothetical protein